LNLSVLLVIALFCFACGLLGVMTIGTWLRSRLILDVPNERSSHASPVPRGGGVAIVAAVLIILGWGVATGRIGPAPAILAVMAASSLVAIVSFIDDLRTLSNRIRIAVHFLAAGITIVAFGPWSRLAAGHGASLDLAPVAAILLTLVWIVGLTNAYNFMDGIDLMAAGQTIAAGIGWIVLGKMLGSLELTLLGVALAFSAAGFAVHNWPPARIFMGDVGSAFLGYLLATMVIMAARYEAVAATCGALLVWPFLFDTAFTFMRRLLKRERVFRAHRSHLYQRLVIAGVPHLRVSALYFALDLIGLGCAVALLRHAAHARALSLSLIGLAATALWLLVVRVERSSANQR